MIGVIGQSKFLCYPYYLPQPQALNQWNVYTEVYMTTAIKYIDNDSVIFYSSLFDCYYLKNLKSLLVSLHDYKTAPDALVSFINNKVMWVEDVKG